MREEECGHDPVIVEVVVGVRDDAAALFVVEVRGESGIQ